MASLFSESEVHKHVWKTGLGKLITPLKAEVPEGEHSSPDPVGESGFGEEDEAEFELWRFIKARAIEKITALHKSVRHGDLIGSKIKLPVDDTRPMELDFLGCYDGGLFIVELKVEKSAERNAFSELLGYSNYLAEMFALSGTKDIVNVLIAGLTNKITRQAYLYDLLVSDRNTVVYEPLFATADLQSLKLQLFFPSDGDFKQFTNQLLSHGAMACVVASFDDVPGWIDAETETACR